MNNDLETQKDIIFYNIYNIFRDLSVTLSYYNLHSSLGQASCIALESDLNDDEEIKKIRNLLHSLAFGLDLTLISADKLMDELRTRMDSAITKEAEKIKNKKAN